MLTGDEVAAHNSRDSCWVIIAGAAYDVTEFLPEHPGGEKIILKYAGRDATVAYEPVHPPGTIERSLLKDKHLGPVDPSTVIKDENDSVDQSYDLPPDAMPLSVCQNLDDLELVAKSKLTRKAYAYYNSAADSLFSLHINRQDWSKVSFRPRVLRNVARVDMRRKVMGHSAELPFFIAPAAMAKLGHPDGEMCLSNGASTQGIVYCASSYSSVAHSDLIVPFRQQQNLGALAFQLYVPKQLQGAEELITNARKLGCTALVVTVDTPVVGKREEDERYKAEIEFMEGEVVPRTSNPAPSDEKPILRGHHSSTLNWDDLNALRQWWGYESGRPFILKGIMTVEDAVKAAEMGVDGIYLSNHGGRQLDYAPSSIRTLLEIRKFRPDILRKMQIYLDGGGANGMFANFETVRRGTDILKAICLGATAVGLGRSFMYSLSAYGTDGVLKAIQLLSDEIETTMRFLGVNSLDELNPDYLNSTILERELPAHSLGSAVRRLLKL